MKSDTNTSRTFNLSPAIMFRIEHPVIAFAQKLAI
jgi:hypothetical protein